ncbi:MAG: hypothetical protein HOC23_22960 [Halieaceae bacterium]|nr:hypothetical protein [Halieaceae bacterium]
MNKYIRNKTPLPAAIFPLLLLFSSAGDASSLNLSYGQLAKHVSYQDQTLSMDPAGPGLALSLDLNEQFTVDFSYHEWEDDSDILNRSAVDAELQTWGTRISYYRDNWAFSLHYYDFEDDTFVASIANPDRRYRHDVTESSYFGGSVGYAWSSNRMFYSVSFGAQIGDWDNKVTQLQDRPPPAPAPRRGPPPPPTIETEATNGDSSSLGASVSLARYWPLTENTGVLVGSLFSWNHMLSGESSLVSRNGQANSPPSNGPGPQGNQNAAVSGFTGDIGSVSGGDSYGQLSLYASLNIIPSWSIDFDTGFYIGTDDSDQFWSVNVAYFF